MATNSTLHNALRGSQSSVSDLARGPRRPFAPHSANINALLSLSIVSRHDMTRSSNLEGPSFIPPLITWPLAQLSQGLVCPIFVAVKVSSGLQRPPLYCPAEEGTRQSLSHRVGRYHLNITAHSDRAVDLLCCLFTRLLLW